MEIGNWLLDKKTIHEGVLKTITVTLQNYSVTQAASQRVMGGK